MKKVLQLSTYPIKNPLHGGQIRVHEIRKFFEGHGLSVTSLSLTEKTHENYSEGDFCIDSEVLHATIDIPFCADYATALLSTKKEYFNFIQQALIELKPDIIFLEQPWLFPAIKKFIQENNTNYIPKIVYSSQNIEYQTKKDILSSHGIGGQNVDAVIDGIYQLEKELCNTADFVITVSKSDSDVFQQMGAKNILICPNGVAHRTIDKALQRDMKNSLNGRKYTLFVGSAYPPNAQGFWKLFGDSMAFLPPEHIIVVAGGVSKILEPYMPESAKLFANVNMNRIKLFGFISEDLLAVLVNMASSIILPIDVGGGSNLKTAEAIASNRPVVATSKACRGFNFTENLSNFLITDNPLEFKKSVLHFLADNFSINQISVNEKDLRETVYWENTLASLTEFISILNINKKNTSLQVDENIPICIQSNQVLSKILEMRTNEFAFINKSYSNDCEWSLFLYMSWEKFVSPKENYYIVVPEKDLNLFKEKFSAAKMSEIILELPIIITEEFIFSKAGIDQDKIELMYKRLGGWGVQQVVKLAFYHTMLAKEYFTIDSACLFYKPINFKKILYDEKDNIFTQGKRVKKDDRASFLNERNVIGHLDSNLVNLSKSFNYIADICQNNTSYSHWYTSGTGIFSSKALLALENYIKSVGMNDFSDMIEHSPYELTWYGEFVFTHTPIPFFPIGPELMKHVHTVDGLKAMEVLELDKYIGLIFQPPLANENIDTIISIINSKFIK
jgi:glycosyltransferase involved in cell wall biosynthesis